MELFKASSQWANRPDDERFETLQDLVKATKQYAKTATVQNVPFRQLRVVEHNGELLLTRGQGGARFSHWGFGQLAQHSGAPASWLRTVPASLAVKNLEYGMQQAVKEDSDKTVKLLMHTVDGVNLVRAFTGEGYGRIWNYEVAERLLNLEAQGWRTPPARPAREGQKGTRLATEADVLRHQGLGGLSVNVGDEIAPAGLYASDHDMFVFLINEDMVIEDGTKNGGLKRGIFVENSEVGAKALKLTRFLYQNVCGNHIVWGASEVDVISVRHVGDVYQKFNQRIAVEIKKYANESASDEEAKIKTAQRVVLGATKDEILDVLFGKRLLTKKLAAHVIDVAYEYAEDEGYNPRSVWGIVQGVTRASQESPYADERTALDRSASRILNLAF